jgi:hypothetical protein
MSYCVPMTDEHIDAVIARMDVSFWLKNAIVTSCQRDLVDAVNDAEMLASVLRDRLNRLQSRGIQNA